MTTQSVDRALDLLMWLQDGSPSLDECAARLDVHKSTALRLLQTMEARGFVTHDESHRYRLGRSVFALAAAALDQWDVRSVVRPHLERLGALTGQTVHLAVFDAGEAVYVDKVEARRGIRMYSRIGLTAPLHCTGVGKVLVAALPEREREVLAQSLEYTRYTERTIQTPAQYLAELEAVRVAGYARDWREHESFMNCIAAPIRDGSGAVVAAVSVSVATVTLTEDDVQAMLPALLRTASDASADLGWSSTSQPLQQGAP